MKLKGNLLVLGSVIGMTIVFGSFCIAHGAQAKKDWPRTLVIEGMGVGSSAYLVNAALGNAFSEELGIRTQVVAGTPMPLCATKVGKGQSDLAIVNGEPPYAAFHGLGNWKGQPLKELRSLAGVTTVPTQFVTWPGAGINSSADLKGKIVMGDRLADKIFGKAIPDAVLAVNGFTREDVKVVGWLEFSEQIKFMNMKLGDAIFLSAGMRTAPVLQLDRTTKLKFISFTPQEVEASLKRNPYLVPFTLPAGTYTQQPKAIACIGVPMVEIIRAGLPDDLVYQICKILYDKPGRFASVHPAFGKFDINFATVPRLVPYHAGAVKYFKERGVWNSQVDQWQKEELKSAGLEK